MTSTPPFLLNEDDIWINQDYSNDYDEFKNKQQFVWCAQLPWLGSEKEAEEMKQQILKNQEIVEKAREKKRWCSPWKGHDNENGRIYQALREILGEKE